MYAHPRPCLIVAGVSVLLAHAVLATHPVPRSTFGRVPARPASLALLVPPESTPMPTTFPDLTRQERALPITAVTARTMKFEQQLTPLRTVAPLVPSDLEPTRFHFEPMPKANPQPTESPPEPATPRASEGNE